MGSFTTALGETYIVERRLPTLGWRPRLRSREHLTGSPSDFVWFGDDLLAGAVFGVVVLVFAVLLFPLLLFVVELALLIAVVIPVLLLGLLVGVVKHTVQIRRGGLGSDVVDRREVRGPVSSWRVARELRAAAEAGAYRNSEPAGAVSESGSVGPPV